MGEARNTLSIAALPTSTIWLIRKRVVWAVVMDGCQSYVST